MAAANKSQEILQICRGVFPGPDLKEICELAGGDYGRGDDPIVFRVKVLCEAGLLQKHDLGEDFHPTYFAE